MRVRDEADENPGQGSGDSGSALTGVRERCFAVPALKHGYYALRKISYRSSLQLSCDWGKFMYLSTIKLA